MEIYIPYQGCPCGPSSHEQDSRAEEFQETLIRLKEKLGSAISYTIYALNLHLQQFKSRPELASILQNQGRKGLPVIFINEQLVIQGRYPDLNELVTVIGPFLSGEQN